MTVSQLYGIPENAAVADSFLLKWLIILTPICTHTAVSSKNARVCIWVSRFICDVTLPASRARLVTSSEVSGVMCRPCRSDICRFGLHIIDQSWVSPCCVSIWHWSVQRSFQPQRKVMSSNVNTRKVRYFSTSLQKKKKKKDLSLWMYCALFSWLYFRKRNNFLHVVCKWYQIALDQLNGVKCLEF